MQSVNEHSGDEAPRHRRRRDFPARTVPVLTPGWSGATGLAVLRLKSGRRIEAMCGWPLAEAEAIGRAVSQQTNRSRRFTLTMPTLNSLDGKYPRGKHLGFR